MYYKNKQTFYIMQYGPKFLLLTIATVLVFVGSYHFLKVNDITDEKVVKAFQNVLTNKEVNNDDKVLEEHASTETLPESSPFVSSFNLEQNALETEFKDKAIKDLEKNELSAECEVIQINDINNIIIKDKDGKNYTICMIGVKPTASLAIDSKQSVLYKKELDDLLKNKKVQIKFDNLKTENNLYFAYVYYKGELLNSHILQYGYSKYKEERSNVTLLDDLKTKQEEAETNNLGIWQN